MKKPIVLVYNARSGGRYSLAKLTPLFAAHRLRITASYAISHTIKTDLTSHIAAGETIVAVGGDGTLSAVASLLVDTTAILAPLPGGTFNNFTKDLGISQNFEEAVARLAIAKPKKIDIGEVNGIYFLNNSSVGLYPRSLRTRKRLEDRLGKWPAAFWAVLRELIWHRTYTFTIGKRSFKTSFIYVGNNRYTIRGFDIPRRTSFSAGILSVFIISATTRFGIARAYVAAAMRSNANVSSFTNFEGESVTISSNKHNHVSVSHDGEVTKTSLPLRYTIHKKALRVLY